MLRVAPALASLAALAALIAAATAAEAMAEDYSHGPAVRDFWKLRTDTGRAEAYYFAMILHPRLTLAYMWLVDPAALPVMLNDPAPLSIVLFGALTPHLFVAQSFYNAFSAANWLITVAFAVSSVKETFREAALVVSICAGYFISRVDAQAEQPGRVLLRKLFRPVLRATLWLVLYGSYLGFLRPILPEVVQNLVFVALASDVAGVFPFKAVGEARERLYRSAEARVLGEPPQSAASGGGAPAGGGGFAAGGGGPNMQFYSFSTGSGGGFQAQSGNIDLQTLFNQMNEEINRQAQAQQQRVRPDQPQFLGGGEANESRFEEIGDEEETVKKDK